MVEAGSVVKTKEKKFQFLICIDDVTMILIFGVVELYPVAEPLYLATSRQMGGRLPLCLYNKREKLLVVVVVD